MSRDEQFARAAADAWEEARLNALQAERHKMIKRVAVWSLIALVAIVLMIWALP